MTLNKNTAHLVQDLEEIIGSCCYNPNSYNGYTGEEGKNYRYRCSYYDDEDGTLCSQKYRIAELSPAEIKTAHYRFGSNHLQIGQGLIRVLNTLENRFDIDFAALVEKGDA